LFVHFSYCKMFSMLQDTAELFFEDVRLPSSALLGGPNKGFYYLMQELPQERLIIASMAQASSEWMFEETRDYVKNRKAFGKTISNLQVWHQQLTHKILYKNCCQNRRPS